MLSLHCSSVKARHRQVAALVQLEDLQTAAEMVSKAKGSKIDPKALAEVAHRSCH